jgi:hypothetical protein
MQDFNKGLAQSAQEADNARRGTSLIFGECGEEFRPRRSSDQQFATLSSQRVLCGQVLVTAPVSLKVEKLLGTTCFEVFSTYTFAMRAVSQENAMNFALGTGNGPPQYQ